MDRKQIEAWGLLLCWGRARMTQQEQPVLSLAKLYANRNSTQQRGNSQYGLRTCVLTDL